MPNWFNLPKEVLNMTFLYVKANDKVHNNKDLSQCSLTCHSWRSAAQNVIFSEIFVDTTNNMDNLSRIVLENDGIAKWVKVLNYSKTYTYNATALLAAGLLFPNLEALDFCGNNVLYSFFCKMLIENGKFKNLTKLPIPANRDQDLMYSQCLDFLQERITSITLFDDEANNRDIYQEVIKKLDRFPKLKKVLIHTIITTDMRYQNLVAYVNTVIENNLAPSLKELCITSSANSSYCFRLSTQGEEGLLPMTKLKSLNVYMYSDEHFNISEDFMLFIMHHCPNLDSLYMKISGEILQCLDTLSYQEILLNFMNYLLKIPNFILQNSVLLTKEARRFIEDDYTAIKKKPASLKLSRALFITADPLISSAESFGVIDFKNDYIMRSQSVDFRILCADFTPVHKVDEEQIKLVEKVGRFFNTVSLQITSSEYLETLLKCVAAIQCGRLNTLIIEGLSEKESVYNESFLQDKEIAHSNSIRELVLSNFCLSQEQLLHLSIVLPRLGKLVLKNFFKHKSLLSGKSFFSFCLPNWSLDCLEIDMDLNFTGSQKEEKYYIKLAADEEHSSRYCFFTVKIVNNKVIGYSLVDSPTQAAFQQSISNREIFTYYISFESVKKFIFKYIDAENGFHKTLCPFGKQSVYNFQ